MPLTQNAAHREVTVRELKTHADLAQAIALEKLVWRLEDADALPLTLAIAMQAAGSLFLGAFCGDVLAGFAFSFPAREHGHWTLHSHMLGVHPHYRDFEIGYRLKLAQRDHALALKIPAISWTFDPLQSKNAHLNFAKLGVISDQYKLDFYGPSTSSELHQNGTDRLWVIWAVASRRVEKRLQGEDVRAEILDTLSRTSLLLQRDAKGKPARGNLDVALAARRIAIEIPSGIDEIERSNPAAAAEWREATRWAFTQALHAGFVVTEFCRDVRGQQGSGAYLLERGSLTEHIPEIA
ncbi:MAG: hypothetical protein H0X25_15850 [Acidobacteriales bacterium]|nr:hypothetical protein [Terriglobales bacterium]